MKPSLRLFLAIFLTIASSCDLSSDPPEDSEAGQSRFEDPPNFVVIVVDDMPPDLLSYMPHVQELLVAQGTNYPLAFATTSGCCPSRASMLTGQYVMHHGVENNSNERGGGERAFEDEDTLATRLRGAGYATGLFGKYLNGYGGRRIPPGWERWVAMTRVAYHRFKVNDQRTLRDFRRRPAVYSTDWLKTRAVEFIEDRTDDQRPFLVWYAPYAPHPPAQVAPRHEGTCDLPPWRPPNHNEEDVSDKPAWVQALPLGDAAEQDAFRNDQACTLKAVDEAVVDLMRALAPVMHETYVIFLGDNSWSALEHRHPDKECVYESCARIPMVIVGPAFEPGVTDERMVLNIDLAPTILSLAGIEVPFYMDGQHVLDPPRTEFLIESYAFSRNEFAVRTERYKYGELETGECELYDLVEDPWELENRCEDPAFAAIQEDLANRLEALREE